ncbi:MAG: VWA domain-containing protein, partial [Planctomycetales bacterium]
ERKLESSSGAWLPRLLGLDAGDIPENATFQFIWTNAPQSWRLFALVALALGMCLLVLHLYRRELDACPTWAKRFLASLRLAVVLTILVVFLGPALAFTQRKTLDPSVVLLRDASQSMNVRDRWQDDELAQAVAEATGRTVEELREQRPSRAELINELLSRGETTLPTRLAERGKLRAVDFSNRNDRVELSRKPKPGEESTVATLPLLNATGRGTNLHRAIEEGLSDRLTAAVVVLTDGQDTVRETQREDFRLLAEKARRQGVPLLMVGIGDPQRPRNLSVADLYADPRVWRDDPFEIQAVLRSQELGEITARVALTEQKLADSGDPLGEERVVDRQEIALSPDVSRVRLSFTRAVQDPGRYLYNVRAEPVENELTEEDNAADAPLEVKVLDEKAKVLLIAGTPSWEYQLLQRLLHREKSVDLSC